MTRITSGVIIHLQGIGVRHWRTTQGNGKPEQRAKALQRIVRQIQGIAFKHTITQLQKNGYVAVSDPYRSLDPFLDNTKVLRVGGRLQNSSLAFEEKHPMLLPAGHEVSWKTRDNNSGRSRKKKPALTTVRRCITCCRARPRLLNQIMSPLSTDRVPFNISGVDYWGPFFVHYKVRGKKPHKV